MKERVSSSAVLEALRTGPFRAPAHAFLYEVRNGTGYGKQQRYADALVVSCWPSRGIWVAGVEVKVSRTDWRRELDDPEKNADIQQYCDFWWIAAPPGVVNLAELPGNWGLLLVDGKTVAQTREAPRLPRKPFDPTFVASILRNAATAQDHARKLGAEDASRRLAELYETESATKIRAEFERAVLDKSKVTDELTQAKRRLEQLHADVSAFEQSARLPAGAISHRFMGKSPAGQLYRVAELLREIRPADLAHQLRAAADSLALLHQSTGEGRETDGRREDAPGAGGCAEPGPRGA